LVAAKNINTHFAAATHLDAAKYEYFRTIFNKIKFSKKYFIKYVKT
jgi:hypothetical protein